MPLAWCVREGERKRTPTTLFFHLFIHSTYHPLWLSSSECKLHVGVVCIPYTLMRPVFAQWLVHSRDSINEGRTNTWMCEIVAWWDRVTRQVWKRAVLRSLQLHSASPSKGASYLGLSHASSSKVSTGMVSVPSSLEGWASQFSLPGSQSARSRQFSARIQYVVFFLK